MKTVFVDVDTQIDFMFPAGALYVPGAERVLPAIRRLNAYAVENDIPLISTMDAHSENDVEFLHWPAHCVVGTEGQKKPQGTVFGTRQIILEKVTTNCFDNPKFEQLVQTLPSERYVVYGVVTEICVKFAAMGLLRTGKRVELVTDAVKHLSETPRDNMLAEFTAGGGVLTTLEAVLQR
jgi:nicotinamidase/pyrazinamidase